MDGQYHESSNVSQVGYTDLRSRPGFKMALQVSDGRWYLYLAHMCHSGWSIVDVTDPQNPTVERFVEGPSNTMTLQIQVADGRMVTSLERPREGIGPVDGPTMDPSEPYETGMYVWDVASDPTAPSLLAHFETSGGGTHRNHYDGGDYVYLNAKLPEYEGGVLLVVDISDPAEPTEVGRWHWPGQAPGEVATVPRYFHGPAYVDDERAYLSYGRVGAVVLDISDRTEPRLLGRLDLGDLGSWIGVHSAVPVPDSDLVVVNSEAIQEAAPLDDGDPWNYAFIVDASDPHSPSFDGIDQEGLKVLSALPHPRPPAESPFDTYYEKPARFGPHNQHHYQGQSAHLARSDLLFMTWFNAGLRVYDIDNPLRPTEVGRFVPSAPDQRIHASRPAGQIGTQLEDVLVDARGYIYCTDPNRGLFVLETSHLD